MRETLIPVLAWLAGVSIGVIFFGGLWWTVRKGITSPHPALWFMGSFLLRMAIALSGFILIARAGGWKTLVMGLLGFVMARFLVTWLTRLQDVAVTPPNTGANHATDPR